MRVTSIVGGVVFLALTIVLFLSLFGPKDDSEPLQTLPEFHLKDLEGLAPLRSRDLEEGYVLLTVFASWCIPCAMEHPQLMDLAREKNLKLYGIAFKDDPRHLRAFLENHGSPFVKVGLSPDGDVGVDLGISGVPETFFLYQGRILRRFKGPLMAQDCVEIRGLLQENPPQ